MTTLLHVCAGGDAPRIAEHETVIHTRSYERVADYAYAASGGLRWLTIHDLSRPPADMASLVDDPGRRGAGGGDGAAPVGGVATGGPDGSGTDAGGAGTTATATSVTATVFEQIAPAEGWLTGGGVVASGDLPEGEVVLSVVMDVEEGALDLFHGWYDEEHLPKLVAVPGIDAARRFRAVAGALSEPGRQRFLALYELTGLEFLETNAWAEAAAMTPRTAEVVPHVILMSQLYRR
jgi:hypothetical protein